MAELKKPDHLANGYRIVCMALVRSIRDASCWADIVEYADVLLRVGRRYDAMRIEEQHIKLGYEQTGGRQAKETHHA